jgi:hypothetical protein
MPYEMLAAVCVPLFKYTFEIKEPQKNFDRRSRVCVRCYCYTNVQVAGETALTPSQVILTVWPKFKTAKTFTLRCDNSIFERKAA